MFIHVKDEVTRLGAPGAGNLLMVLCVTMAAAVLSASFAVFLVREAESRSKHVQVHCSIALFLPLPIRMIGAMIACLGWVLYLRHQLLALGSKPKHAQMQWCIAMMHELWLIDRHDRAVRGSPKVACNALLQAIG